MSRDGNSSGRSRKTDDAQAAHQGFMRRALDEARRGRDLGEVPVGAVLVAGGEVIAKGCNQPIKDVDPTAHAEVVALREAARRMGNYRLPGSTLYVTVEPCLMCVGALVHARVGTVVYGTGDPKGGAMESILALNALRLNHRMESISGVLEEECRRLLVDFFRFRRAEPLG